MFCNCQNKTDKSEESNNDQVNTFIQKVDITQLFVKHIGLYVPTLKPQYQHYGIVFIIIVSELMLVYLKILS